MDYLPSGLNPLVSQDFWVHLMALRTVFEPLVVLDVDGSVRPFLASSVEVEDHGRRFRFTIRPGVTFHDGRPLTSADVAYTLEAVVKRAHRYRGAVSLLHAELQQVQEVRAPNDHTVELVLRRRNHLFPAVLAELPIVPAHLYHKHGLRNPRLNRSPVGTGPFKLAAPAAPSQPEQPKPTSLALVRNESYWGRKASLARLVFVAVGDPARALARLRNGEIDMIPNLHPSYYPEQVKTKRMQRRFRLFRIHPYRLRILLYNVDRGPLKDRRVRVALAHLADRQRFIREIRNSLGQVLAVPISPLSSWYDKSIHPYLYDRKEALRLLEAAGWNRTPKGRRRNGYPLSLKMLVAREAPAMSKVAGQLRAELLAAGGQMVVKTGDFGFIKTQLRRGHFDLTLLGLAPRPYSDLSPLLHSKGRVNLGGYHNPMVDRLLDGIRATSQEGTRQRLLRQLYRVLHQDPPFLVLYAPIELMLVSRDVKGIASNGRRPVFSALSR